MVELRNEALYNYKVNGKYIEIKARSKKGAALKLALENNVPPSSAQQYACKHEVGFQFGYNTKFPNVYGIEKAMLLLIREEIDAYIEIEQSIEDQGEDSPYGEMMTPVEEMSRILEEFFSQRFGLETGDAEDSGTVTGRAKMDEPCIGEAE